MKLRFKATKQKIALCAIFLFGLKNAVKSQTYACTLADLSGETSEARP